MSKPAKPGILQETLILRWIIFAGLGYSTLYTVPPHTRFLMWGYDVNCAVANAALALAGTLFLEDGTGQYSFCQLRGPPTTLALHSQNSFNLLELAAGASLRVYADANTTIHACMFGLEVIYAPV